MPTELASELLKKSIVLPSKLHEKTYLNPPFPQHNPPGAGSLLSWPAPLTFPCGVVREADSPGRLIVGKVVSGSGAARAGIRHGHQIVGIDRNVLRSSAHAAELLNRYRIGETVPYLVRGPLGLQEVDVDLGYRQIGSLPYLVAWALEKNGDLEASTRMVERVREVNPLLPRPTTGSATVFPSLEFPATHALSLAVGRQKGSLWTSSPTLATHR